MRVSRFPFSCWHFHTTEKVVEGGIEEVGADGAGLASASSASHCFHARHDLCLFHQWGNWHPVSRSHPHGTRHSFVSYQDTAKHWLDQFP